MNLKKLPLVVYFISWTSIAISSQFYFLCGPDEDGCFEDIYSSCVCIPYHEQEANRPFCLDFNVLKCTPISQTPNCEPMFTFKNQGECLATIFQSEPTPPCTLTTHEFCLQEHMAICDENGQLDSCVHS